MNIAEKVAKLFAKEGKTIHIYEKKKRLGLIDQDVLHGWLWIEDRGDHWHITFAMNITYAKKHDDDYAYGADFQKDTGKLKEGPDITGVWIVSANREPVTDPDELARISKLISDHIQMACDYYYEQQ